MPKTDSLKIRVTPAEKASFELASGLAGIALSAWVRERLRRACQRELEAAGEQIPFVQAMKEHRG